MTHQPDPPGPSYQPPSYPPPSFHPPSYPPPYPGATGGPSRTLATWALVLALLGFCGVTAVVGLILGIVALTRVKDGRGAGKGLAIGAVVVAAAWIVAGFVAFALLAVFGNSLAERDGDGRIVDAGRVFLADLRVGDCVEDVLEEKRMRMVVGVPCAAPHQHEVFGSFELPDGPFPGQASVDQQSEARCFALLPAYIGGPARGLELVYFRPDEQGWEADREVLCLVTTGTSRSGSLRGTARQ